MIAFYHQIKTHFINIFSVKTTRQKYLSCLQRRPDIPTPEGKGWLKKEGSLVIDWMSLPPAPDSIMELVHCSCKSTGCAKGKCSCLSNLFLCTDLCFCENCKNCEISEIDKIRFQ